MSNLDKFKGAVTSCDSDEDFKYIDHPKAIGELDFKKLPDIRGRGPCYLVDERVIGVTYTDYSYPIRVRIYQCKDIIEKYNG